MLKKSVLVLVGIFLATFIHADQSIDQDITFNNNVTFNDNVIIDGVTLKNSHLELSAKSNFTVNGESLFKKQVTFNEAVNMMTTLNVSGVTTINGLANFEDVFFKGSVTLNGDTSFNGTIITPLSFTTGLGIETNVNGDFYRIIPLRSDLTALPGSVLSQGIALESPHYINFINNNGTTDNSDDKLNGYMDMANSVLSWRGYLGIGTVPEAPLHVKSENRPVVFEGTTSSGIMLSLKKDLTKWDIGINSSDHFSILNDGNSYLTIDNAGTIYIPNTLKVESILASEIIVEENIFPDYVFSSDYNLKSLKEVDEYIKKNKHLPGIPSAKHVKENGLELTSLVVKQMEKIEELTLYVIDWDKRNSAMEEDLSKLEKLLSGDNE